MKKAVNHSERDTHAVFHSCPDSLLCKTMQLRRAFLSIAACSTFVSNGSSFFTISAAIDMQLSTNSRYVSLSPHISTSADRTLPPAAVTGLASCMRSVWSTKCSSGPSLCVVTSLVSVTSSFCCNFQNGKRKSTCHSQPEYGQTIVQILLHNLQINYNFFCKTQQFGVLSLRVSCDCWLTCNLEDFVCCHAMSKRSK
jgi:hypothetical protein